MDRTPLNKQLAERCDYDIAGVRANKAYLKLPEIKRILDTVDYLIEKHGLGTYTTVGYYGTSVYLTAKDLNGLKDESLAALLDALVHSNPGRTSSNDYAKDFSRSYTFEWTTAEPEAYGGHYPTFKVVVTAYFKEDSDTCRRVIVGYNEPDKAPRPIYELKCADDETGPITE